MLRNLLHRKLLSEVRDVAAHRQQTRRDLRDPQALSKLAWTARAQQTSLAWVKPAVCLNASRTTFCRSNVTAAIWSSVLSIVRTKTMRAVSQVHVRRIRSYARSAPRQSSFLQQTLQIQSLSSIPGKIVTPPTTLRCIRDPGVQHTDAEKSLVPSTHILARSAASKCA